MLTKVIFKRKYLVQALSIILSVSVSLSACLPAIQTGGVENNTDEPEIASDFQIQTAIAKTSIAETAAAPPPTSTDTPTPEFTNTPTMTNTPESSSTPSVEPTSDNPWVLQPWCKSHTGCEKMEVKNQSVHWINVYLEFIETGTSKFFSIPPKGHAWITMRPGMYNYVLTSCSGESVQQGNHGLNSHWYLIFKDKWCK